MRHVFLFPRFFGNQRRIAYALNSISTNFHQNRRISPTTCGTTLKRFDIKVSDGSNAVLGRLGAMIS